MPPKKSSSKSLHQDSSGAAGGSFVNTLFRNIKKGNDDAVRDAIKKQFINIQQDANDDDGEDHHHHLSIPKTVKESIASLTHPDSNQPLMFNTVRCGSENVLQVLVEEFGIIPDALPSHLCPRGKNGLPIIFPPPFLEAARLDDDVIVRYLIEETEANLTAVDERTNQNVFHIMAQSGSSALFDFLIEEVPEKRFNLHYCHHRNDDDGENVDETKRMKRHFVTGKAMLLLSPDNDGNTPLHLCILNQSPSMLQSSLIYLESLVKKHKEDFSNVEFLKKDVLDVFTQQGLAALLFEDHGVNGNNSSSLNSAKTLKVVEIAVSSFGLNAFSQVPFVDNLSDDDYDEEEIEQKQQQQQQVPLLYRLIANVNEQDAKNGSLVPIIRTLLGGGGSENGNFKLIPNWNAPNIDPVQKAFRVLMSCCCCGSSSSCTSNQKQKRTPRSSIFDLVLREPVSIDTFKAMLSFDLSPIYEDEDSTVLSFETCVEKLQKSFYSTLKKQLAPDDITNSQTDSNGEEGEAEYVYEVDTYFTSEHAASQFVGSLENILNSIFLKFEIVSSEFAKQFSQDAETELKNFVQKLQILQEARRIAEEEENKRRNGQLVLGGGGSNNNNMIRGDYSGTSSMDAVERARFAAERIQSSRLEKIQKRRNAEAAAEEPDYSHMSSAEKLLHQAFGGGKKRLIKSSGNDIFGKGTRQGGQDDDNDEESVVPETNTKGETKNTDAKGPSGLLKNNSGGSISNKKKDESEGLSLSEKIVIIMIIMAFVFGFVQIQG